MHRRVLLFSPHAEGLADMPSSDRQPTHQNGDPIGRSAPLPVRPLLLGMGWFPDQPGGLNRFFAGLRGAVADRVEDCRAVVCGPVSAPPADVYVAGAADEPSAAR